MWVLLSKGRCWAVRMLPLHAWLKAESCHRGKTCQVQAVCYEQRP